MVVLVFAGAVRGNPPEIPLLSPSSTSAATPALKAAPTPTPMPARLAPIGVLYLTEDVTVPLKYGLKGVSAGTEVKVIKENGDTVLVTDGEDQFTMKKSQVTDNLDVAAAVQKYAAALEAANTAWHRQQEAVYVQQQRDYIEFLRAHPLATPTPTPTPGK